jgi:D-alanyl-D-alanine carboxypeptidase
MKRYRKIFILLFVGAAVIFINNNVALPELKTTTDQDISASSLKASASLIKNEVVIKFNPELPEKLDLQSALIKDLESNSYYLRMKTQQQWPMASLTKLLTSVIALEKITPSAKVDQLVKRMMIYSDNRAAEQLAEAYGRQEFLTAMQEKTEQLGMKNTSIFDESGLSFLNQSTVEDLEKLVVYITKKHPKIFQFSRELEIVVNNNRRKNINKFAGQSDFLGGKTGYTDEAHGNLITLFEFNGHPVMIIVLGTANRHERFNQTNILRKWISKFYNS